MGRESAVMWAKIYQDADGRIWHVRQIDLGRAHGPTITGDCLQTHETRTWLQEQLDQLTELALVPKSRAEAAGIPLIPLS
jgi:hypothetical protein